MINDGCYACIDALQTARYLAPEYVLWGVVVGLDASLDSLTDGLWMGERRGVPETI